LQNGGDLYLADKKNIYYDNTNLCWEVTTEDYDDEKDDFVINTSNVFFEKELLLLFREKINEALSIAPEVGVPTDL